MTRGACDVKVAEIRGWSWSATPFSLPSKFSLSLSIITAQFRYFLSDSRACRRTVNVHLVKLAPRGLKSERRILPSRSPSAFRSSFTRLRSLFAVRALLSSTKSSSPPSLPPSPRPFRVAAKAISGDSWGDYCGAAKRERRSRPPPPPLKST